MDQHFWHNVPNMVPYYSDLNKEHNACNNYDHRPRTTLELFSGPPVTNVIVQQVQVCNHVQQVQVCNHVQQVQVCNHEPQPNFQNPYTPSHLPQPSPGPNINYQSTSEFSQFGPISNNQIHSDYYKPSDHSIAGPVINNQSCVDVSRPVTSDGYGYKRHEPSEKLQNYVNELSYFLEPSKTVKDYPHSSGEQAFYHSREPNEKFKNYLKPVDKLSSHRNADVHFHSPRLKSADISNEKPFVQTNTFPKRRLSERSRRHAYRSPIRKSRSRAVVSTKRKLHSPLSKKPKDRRNHTNTSYLRGSCTTHSRRENYRRSNTNRRQDQRRSEAERKLDLEAMPEKEKQICTRTSRADNPGPNNTNRRQDQRRSEAERKLDLEAMLEKEKQIWTRTSPADLFYNPGPNYSSTLKTVQGTDRLDGLCKEFDKKLLKKAAEIRANLPKYEPPKRKKKISIKKHTDCHSSSNSDSSCCESDREDHINEELDHKKKHPLRLHEELWFNDPGEMNDGPLCRCSAKAQRSGIRHNIYAGENHLTPCDPNSNNADRLYHYRITMTPTKNFIVPSPTVIEHDGQEFVFEGFSMFSHKKLGELPLCKVIRFNIEYTILYYEENFPQNFTVKELNLFYTYLFHEILELVDLDFRAAGDPDGCPQYHFMPRFVRALEGNGKEILSMNIVLKYLLHSAKPLIPKEELQKILKMPQFDWQRFTENIKGMIVTYPGKKPSSLRVDQLDRDQDKKSIQQFPQIVHFGIRPPQLSYAGNPEYQKAWREYVKFRHLLANMPKPSRPDKRKLHQKENRLQSMRTKSELKRNVTVTVSCENFHLTGIMCDVVQHAMLIPVLVSHLRFHRSLDVLEERISYKFDNRYLLQLALTHPSYRENFGTNPDHARNALTNCGIRQPQYGDRKIHYQNTRKRGINTLISIMSRFGKNEETESQITHNERLEFLGDAVVEFVTSVHLFYIFSDLEEGGLATYRAAIVQNQHLALLAKILNLEDFMLYAHGSDLCHDLELRHAMANCFEALMGALFLDGGIQIADKVFGEALFHDDAGLLLEWVNYPPHPLQEQEPLGDRKWIKEVKMLKDLAEFEQSIGIQFSHIRLLARAFTDRSIGFTHLTLGSNQRLEFLGDTVLQLIASEYLYKFFPEHHEGHLSLLRSSLVNNKTQSVVCDDLGMTKYALYSNPKAELKIKDRADLLESFLGALFVDKDLEFCNVFCNVCFFPRLSDFIKNQDWNDPKSKLQQCCLTLRTMEGGEPEIPVYKVIECMGPTNTRIYTVAVYFKNRRLAKASGHSIQQAEMNAAQKALSNSQGLFPQLDHQRRVISKSMNRQKKGPNHRYPASNKEDPLCEKNKNKIKNQEMCKTRSPAKRETTVDDIFSQKIKCRTPPRAYRTQNSPISPKIKSKVSEDEEKIRDRSKVQKIKSQTSTSSRANRELKEQNNDRSNHSYEQQPAQKKPRRSRSSSKVPDDSQKMRCRTPPLAYQKKISQSPELPATTKTDSNKADKCPVQQIKSETSSSSCHRANRELKEQNNDRSDNLYKQQPAHRKPRRSRSSSIPRNHITKQPTNLPGTSKTDRNKEDRCPVQKIKSQTSPISCRRTNRELKEQKHDRSDNLYKKQSPQRKTRRSRSSSIPRNHINHNESVRNKDSMNTTCPVSRERENSVNNPRTNSTKAESRNRSDRLPQRGTSTRETTSTSNPIPVVSSVKSFSNVIDKHSTTASQRRSQDVHSYERKSEIISKEREMRLPGRSLPYSRNNHKSPARFSETTYRRRSRSKSPKNRSHLEPHRWSPNRSRSRSPKNPSRRSPLHSRTRYTLPEENRATSSSRRSRSRSPKNPSYFKSQGTPSRSPHRERCPQENFNVKMTDFVLGKESSPGILPKSKSSTDWLFDLMYKK